MDRLTSYVKKAAEFVGGYEVHSTRKGTILLLDKDIDESVHGESLWRYLSQVGLRSILRLYEIDIVLDVGANVGQFAKSLRRLGYKGKIISFEPVTTSFDALQKTAADDANWDTYNFALGSQEVELPIRVTKANVFSSFRTANSLSKQLFGDQSGKSEIEVVQVRRLDNVLGDLVADFDKARVFLKIDTQGYDLEVFAGLGDRRDHIVGLQSELSVLPIYHEMPGLTDSLIAYEDAGFELVGLYPVATETATLRIIEIDCQMVNRRYQLGARVVEAE